MARQSAWGGGGGRVTGQIDTYITKTVTNMENREEIQLSLIIVRHYIVMKLMSRKDCTAGNLILLLTNA